MEKASYQDMVALRKKCEKQMASMRDSLKTLMEDMASFYNTMRWGGVYCSEEEYSQLYENFIYPYEEGRVNEAMEPLCQFFDPATRKSI